MAKVYDSLTLRKLLNTTSTSASKLSEMGQEFASQGFLSDAVDFYAKANDQAGLSQVLDQAMDEGDYFLFTRIKKILGLPAGPKNISDWLPGRRTGQAGFCRPGPGQNHGTREPGR